GFVGFFGMEGSLFGLVLSGACVPMQGRLVVPMEVARSIPKSRTLLDLKQDPGLGDRFCGHSMRAACRRKAATRADPLHSPVCRFRSPHHFYLRNSHATSRSSR